MRRMVNSSLITATMVLPSEGERLRSTMRISPEKIRALRMELPETLKKYVADSFFTRRLFKSSVSPS